MDYMDVVTAMLGEPRAFDHKATRLQSGHMPHSQRTPDTLDICLYTAKSDWLQYQMKSSKRTTAKNDRPGCHGASKGSHDPRQLSNIMPSRLFHATQGVVRQQNYRSRASRQQEHSARLHRRMLRQHNHTPRTRR